MAKPREDREETTRKSPVEHTSLSGHEGVSSVLQKYLFVTLHTRRTSRKSTKKSTRESAEIEPQLDQKICDEERYPGGEHYSLHYSLLFAGWKMIKILHISSKWKSQTETPVLCSQKRMNREWLSRVRSHVRWWIPKRTAPLNGPAKRFAAVDSKRLHGSSKRLVRMAVNRSDESPGSWSVRSLPPGSLAALASSRRPGPARPRRTSPCRSSWWLLHFRLRKKRFGQRGVEWYTKSDFRIRIFDVLAQHLRSNAYSAFALPYDIKSISNSSSISSPSMKSTLLKLILLCAWEREGELAFGWWISAGWLATDRQQIYNRSTLFRLPNEILQ